MAIRRPNVEPIILDVTEPEHIEALVERLKTDRQRRALHALINNAGIGVNVPVEIYPLDQWRHLYEVNFFGHVAMTQALLPMLIASKGRVLNISSVGGRVAMATYGPYAGTKFALEALSDSLRRELAPLGVKVIVLEPGAVVTEMPGRAMSTAKDLAATMSPEQVRHYGGLVQAISADTAGHTGSRLPAKGAA